ncbi:MAG: SagB/ThcOx family dehydrogenase [Pyrinomonadaceae bacterium]
MAELEIQVAELFHENTKMLPYENGDDPALLPEAIKPGVVLARYRLPRVSPGERGGNLEHAIYNRVTSRNFYPGATLPLEILSRLFAFSCGCTTDFSAANIPQLEFRRSAPSAGATYPIEMYLAARSIASIPDGIYHYSNIDHSLELIRLGNFHPSISKWTLHQPYIADTNAIFLMAGFSDRIYPRYNERGYRYMLLEAGHIAQNTCLLATAYGLGVLSNGGFDDTAINRLLGLNEITEIALYITATGVLKPPWK